MDTLRSDLFGVEYDVSDRVTIKPKELRSHFWTSIKDSKIHWFFVEAVGAAEHGLYLPCLLSLLNGIEASLRVTLHKYDDGGGVHKHLPKGKDNVLDNRLLYRGKGIGLPIELLRLPDEDKEKFDKGVSFNNSAKPVGIVKLRNDLCHGNLSKYMTAVSEESAVFQPERLHKLTYNLMMLSYDWTSGLGAWRLNLEIAAENSQNQEEIH